MSNQPKYALKFRVKHLDKLPLTNNTLALPFGIFTITEDGYDHAELNCSESQLYELITYLQGFGITPTIKTRPTPEASPFDPITQCLHLELSPECEERAKNLHLLPDIDGVTLTNHTLTISVNALGRVINYLLLACHTPSINQELAALRLQSKVCKNLATTLLDLNIPQSGLQSLSLAKLSDVLITLSGQIEDILASSSNSS